MSDHIAQQAADWIARRNGGLPAAEQAALNAWVAQNPRHARALADLERTWNQLNEPRQCGQADQVWSKIETLRQRRSRRRQAAWSAFGLAAVIALLSTVAFRLPLSPIPAPAAVAIRPEIRTLADGSRVALRPGAAIAVDFRSGLRRVDLVRGEALFSVAREATRPFIVHSGKVEVRAVGTEFSVAQGANVITVLVTEGRIAVTQADGPAGSDVDSLPPVYASAGERVRVLAAGAAGAQPAVTRVPDTEIASALAWRGERLEFSDMPLAEAVRLINRGKNVQVVLADLELGRRTVTGVLWADDSDGFVRLLEQGFDLNAERDGNVVRLRPRR